MAARTSLARTMPPACPASHMPAIEAGRAQMKPSHPKSRRPHRYGRHRNVAARTPTQRHQASAVTSKAKTATNEPHRPRMLVYAASETAAISSTPDRMRAYDRPRDLLGDSCDPISRHVLSVVNRKHHRMAATGQWERAARGRNSKRRGEADDAVSMMHILPICARRPRLPLAAISPSIARRPLPALARSHKTRHAARSPTPPQIPPEKIALGRML